MNYGLLIVCICFGVSGWASKPDGKTPDLSGHSTVRTTSSGDTFISAVKTDSVNRHVNTNVMRYPQMNLHWERRSLYAETRTILVLGAGLRDGVIPQLHEIQSSFPEAKITVVDIEQGVGDAMKTSRYKKLKEYSEGLFDWPKNFEKLGRRRDIWKKGTKKVNKGSV